jgi:hypothetical protein
VRSNWNPGLRIDSSRMSSSSTTSPTEQHG